MNIVVTGGTDGIGLALVKKLLSLNHKVLMIGKDSEKA
jgi:NAD(P)-dependent dehydrogenase (short-subunit alcohol dehydrogenase family)